MNSTNAATGEHPGIVAGERRGVGRLLRSFDGGSQVGGSVACGVLGQGRRAKQ